MAQNKKVSKGPKWGEKCVAHIKQLELVIDSLQNLTRRLKTCGLLSILILALPHIGDFLAKLN